MSFDFDQVKERKNTNSVKWDATENLFGEKDLLPMWVADMDFQSPDAVTNAIVNRAKHGIFGYTLTPDTTYEALIQWINTRHKWQLQKDWIVFTPGVVPSLNMIVRAFTNKGDKVLVQPPVYYPFFKTITQNDRNLVENPLLLIEGKYEMDFDDLERKLSDPKVKLFILCSPHNPVGRVWDQDELIRLGDLCITHNVLMVSDEIHSDLIINSNLRHIPFGSLKEEFSTNSITCYAPSKTFNLAGLQVSATIITNSTIRKKFSEQMEKQGIHTINTFGVTGFEAAYKYGQPWLEELLIYLRENIIYLKKFIAENLPEVKVIEPEGTYLVWLDFRNLGLRTKELEQLMLKKAKVALDEGYIFGKEGAGFERINIACPRVLLKEGLERIADAVHTLQKQTK